MSVADLKREVLALRQKQREAEHLQSQVESLQAEVEDLRARNMTLEVSLAIAREADNLASPVRV